MSLGRVRVLPVVVTPTEQLTVGRVELSPRTDASGDDLVHVERTSALDLGDDRLASTRPVPVTNLLDDGPTRLRLLGPLRRPRSEPGPLHSSTFR